MDTNEVHIAFEILLEEIETVVDSVNDEVGKAAQERDYDRVKTLADTADTVTALHGKVHDLQDEWLIITQPKPSGKGGKRTAKGQAILQVKDRHEGLERSTNLFQAPVVYAERHDAGHTVQDLEGQRFMADVGHRHLPDQPGKGFAGQGEVEDIGLDAVGRA